MKRVAAFAYLLICVSAGGAFAQAGSGVGDAPGANQFGQPETIELIREVAKKWVASGAAPFGVGDVSKADAFVPPEHFATGDHKTGLGIDIRPIRKDNQPAGVRWQEPAYDRAATQKLVDMFNETGRVDRIAFGDAQVSGVKVYRGLDDHMHITVKPRLN
ncbi:MAG: hypothetical protein K1X51_13195 [Rhodospirillaceae bacterium]|nr:hypothetical protein [Rhodospirillaceae bacterium]